MIGQAPKPRKGDWRGTILLLSGGSHMGKSFFAKTVLSTEYGAVYRQVDNIYTIAVNDAKMVVAGADGIAASDADIRRAERDARRLARDRSWPSQAVKSSFFTSFKNQIRKVCREGFRQKTAIVIEGGSLRKKEEVEIIARLAREVHGPDVRLIRITVEAPYERWLQNRVNRMLKSGVDLTPLSKLSLDTYTAEANAANPKPHRDVLDRKVQNVDDVHRMMAELDRAANAGAPRK